MTTTIEMARLSVGSTYKLFFVGFAFSVVPLCVLFGVMAFFGADTVQWNGRQLHGLAGLLASPCLGLLAAIFMTAFLGTACLTGLWLHSRWRSLTLRFVPVRQQP